MSNTGANPQNMVNRAKAGGSTGTMILGTSVLATGFLAFWLTQGWAHRNDNQIWKHRVNQQHMGPQNVKSNSGSRAVDPPRAPADPQEPQIPLPDNDISGTDNLSTSFTSFMAGKGLNPDQSVPKDSQNKIAPYGPQRQTEDGATYTKRGSYRSGFMDKPTNYEKTPHNLDGKSTTGNR